MGLILCGPMFGQQQFVKPNPDDGSPMFLLSMDGMNWEVPVQVSRDPKFDLFTTRDSLIVSAHSFDRDGKYFVLLYAHYKNDYPCKGMFTAEQKAKIPGFYSACPLLAYDLSWLQVDTQKKVFRVSRAFHITPDGRFDSFASPTEWTPIDKAGGLFKLAIGDITERLRKEVRQEKLMGKF